MRPVTTINTFLFAIITSGCVVRTQEFHCVMQSNPAETFEMSMSPTSLTYKSERLGFRDETGMERTYGVSGGSPSVTFNVASGRLSARVAGETTEWQCKRYEPLESIAPK
jgi:hypothetical protein